MKKILLSMLCLFASVAMWSQSISDQEVVNYALELRKSGVSNADMVKQLMERGATVEQLQRLRQQYSKQITERGLDNAVDNSIDNAKERMRVNNEVKSDKTGRTGKADQAGLTTQQLTTQQSGDMSLFPDIDEQDLKSKGKKVFGRDIFWVLAISSSSISMALRRRAVHSLLALMVMLLCLISDLSMSVAFL